MNLEEHYQDYLKRMNLKEERMHPQQKIQLRQTFMGACGVMLVYFLEEISKLDEEEAVAEMANIRDQVKQFFIDQLNSRN
jgi:hypothetical protein